MYKNFLKPLFDRFLALIATVILFIPMLLIAVLIYLDDPGPVLFKQRRVGKSKSGQVQYFNLFKFRTMKMCTPHDTPTHLLENPDFYITRIGRFLRKTSLDEIVQIPFNILTGQMSIVGPRPALWNQDDLVAEREKYGANDVYPGLTGWAQINGRDELEIPVKAKLDGEYAYALNCGKFRGLLMDIKCFFGTVISVLKSEGVVEGAVAASEKIDKDQEAKIK